MPIYEYVCLDCGHELEALQKMADAPLVNCPECEHDSLKKKISAAAFRLKGAGWYETDFKTGDKKKNLVDGAEKKSDKSEKSDQGAGGSSSDSKSETKKADKPAEKPTKSDSSKSTGSNAKSA